MHIVSIEALLTNAFIWVWGSDTRNLHSILFLRFLAEIVRTMWSLYGFHSIVILIDIFVAVFFY